MARKPDLAVSGPPRLSVNIPLKSTFTDTLTGYEFRGFWAGRRSFGVETGPVAGTTHENSR
jgi:hypothetical protein